MLPLPLAVSVVAALMPPVMMLHPVPLAAVRLLTPLLVLAAMSSVRLGVGGSLGDKVRLARGRVCGSFPKKLGSVASLLRRRVPLALVEDVRLVTGGCGEVLTLSEAARHGPQEVVCVRCPDQT